MNATTWTRRVAESGSDYGRDRMRDTWPAIHRVAQISPEVVGFLLREACGREGDEASPPRFQSSKIGDGVIAIAEGVEVVDLDFSVGSDFFDDLDWTNSQSIRARLSLILGESRQRVGVVGHLQSTLFAGAQRNVGTDEPTTVPLGLGLLAPLGQSIKLGFDSLVVTSSGTEGPVVLRHGSEGQFFWTCWWGLDGVSDVGSTVAAAQSIGSVPIGIVEGDRLEGLVQVVGTTSERLARRSLPRFVRPSERDAWAALTFDPRALLGLEAAEPSRHWRGDQVLAFRTNTWEGRSARTTSVR